MPGRYVRITINMVYKSQDLQEMLAAHLNLDKVSFSTSLLQAAAQYHPRLHRLLTQPDDKAFESDIDLLANFIQNSQYTPQFSMNPYSRLYQVNKKMHTEARKLANNRIAKEEAKPEYRLKRIKEQLSQLKELKAGVHPETREKINAAMTRFNIRKLKTQGQRRQAAAEFVSELTGTEQEVQHLTKKVLIRKSRTQSERRERADDLVHTIVDYRTSDRDDIGNDANRPGVKDTGTSIPPPLAV